MGSKQILSDRTNGLILLVWVVISVSVLLYLSVISIMGQSLLDTVFGIFAAIFSIIPIFVYFDLRGTDGE